MPRALHFLHPWALAALPPMWALALWLTRRRAEVAPAADAGNFLQQLLIQIGVAGDAEERLAHRGAVDAQPGFGREPGGLERRHHAGVVAPVGEQNQQRLAVSVRAAIILAQRLDR